MVFAQIVLGVVLVLRSVARNLALVGLVSVLIQEVGFAILFLCGPERCRHCSVFVYSEFCLCRYRVAFRCYGLLKDVCLAGLKLRPEVMRLALC